jgi:O-antigen/teichoic acid export membrane protein
MTGPGMAIGVLDKFWSRLRIGRIGRNTLFSSAGLGLRALIQAGYLILLSRWMGPEGYGFFAGSVAAVILLGPLCGWGVAYLLSDRVGRDGSMLAPLWATALVQVMLTGLLLVGLVLLVSAWWLGQRVSASAMLLLALAELVALPVANMATSASLAVDRGVAAACAMCLVPAGRLIVAATFILLGWQGAPDGVAAMHFGGSVAGALVALWLVARLGGSPAWRQRLPLRQATAEGTRYAVGALVGTSYQEIDKVLMLQLLGATAVGTYTAAFRVVSVFVLPVAALMGVALPRLYAARGSAEASRIHRAVALAAIGYAVVATLVAAMVSPLLPYVFGADFAASSKYMLMLSLWIIPFALHQYAATGLTTCGRQGARVAIESAGLLLVVALNLWLLRAFGRGGAVAALLVTEAFMAAGCWIVLSRLKR